MPHFHIRLLILLFVLLYTNNSFAAKCEHVFVNNWGSGFQAEIQITNTDSTTISSFAITWSYSDNTSVSNIWNASGSGTNPVTATSPSWFGGIAPGTTYAIGLNASGAGAGVSISGDVCGTTAAPQEAKFQLVKVWVDGILGNEITVATTGLLNNATINSTSSGSNSDTGNGVIVTVGETATLPAETFNSGAASNYTASDWVCDDAANSVIAPNGTLPITAADADNLISCTLTNTFNDTTTPPSDTKCEHIVVNDWGSVYEGEVQITNTGTTAIDNWTATWNYSDGTAIANLWNGIATGSNPVTVVPPNWFSTLAPGATFSIGFTANGGGDIDSLSCSTGAIESSSLTLTKELTNDHGGTATTSDWTLEANVAGGIAELSGTSGVTSTTLVAGSYELSETGPAGYTQTNLTCDSGALTNTTLTIASGDNVTCTFYNDDQPASLTLVKVVNNTIGTATANDWTLNAAQAGASILSGTSGTAGVTSNSLSAGDYVLSESAGPDGYSLESLVCDAGSFISASNVLSLTNGEVAVCTFTNRDAVVDLTITKSVDNLTPNIGDTINFSLVVTNLGPDPATNVDVDDKLPNGLSFVAMTGGDFQNHSAQILSWTINYLGVGAANSQTLQYQVMVNSVP